VYYANKKHNWFADFNETYRRLRAKPYFRFLHFMDHVLDFDNDAVPGNGSYLVISAADYAPC
jgi:hypothetical protein